MVGSAQGLRLGEKTGTRMERKLHTDSQAGRAHVRLCKGPTGTTWVLPGSRWVMSQCFSVSITYPHARLQICVSSIRRISQFMRNNPVPERCNCFRPFLLNAQDIPEMKTCSVDLRTCQSFTGCFPDAVLLVHLEVIP